MDLNLFTHQIVDFSEKKIQHQTHPWSLIEPSSILPDGTKLTCDQMGNITFAHYPSGAMVKRFGEFVMSTNQFGEHWFCTRQSAWLRVD
jgi:hypothetical protein